MYIVALAFLAFAVLHSITVSRAFKGIVSSIIGETRVRAYYRIWFTVFSALITALAAYIIVSQPDTTIYRPPIILVLPARLMQLGGVALMLAAFRPFDLKTFLGIRQALGYIKTNKTSGDIEGIEHGVLTRTGAYGVVRHPMYVGGTMIFLFEPVVTSNNLVLRALAVAYFFFGMFIEERRFLQDYGISYQDYQAEVPMWNVAAGLARKFFCRS